MSKSNLFRAPGNYQLTKSALERQTATLLAERRQIDGTYQYSRPPTKLGYHQYTSLTPIVHNQPQKQHKTQQIVGKLQQIIKLCKQEGTLSNQQMRQVVKVQSQVLKYLQRTSTQPELNVFRPAYSTDFVNRSKPDIPPSFPSNPSVNQTWGNQKSNRPILSEDTLQIIAQIQRKALGEIINLQQQKEAIKKQKQHFSQEYQKLRLYILKLNAGEAPQHSQTQQLVTLRQQNYRLKLQNAQMQRIKQQNKILKDENQYLNSKLDAIKNVNNIEQRQTVKVDHASGQSNQFNIGLVQGQYSSQIAVYENQLKRATVVINQLRSKLANVPGLEQLHDQGERIRRQTTQILRIKNSGYHPQEPQTIRDLQEKLANEERGKAIFLEELKSFKQRYLELEEENKYLRKSKVSFDTHPKPSGSSPRHQKDMTSPRPGIIKKKNSFLGDYEQTLQDLKHVLY